MKVFLPLQDELEKIATTVVDAAYKIHKALGAGLIESVYEKCLIYELRKRDLLVEDQLYLPVHYEEIVIESGLRPTY